jgi:hypothetical protein
VPLLGNPVWVDDDHFNLIYHLRHTALPPPGDLRQLKRLADASCRRSSIAGSRSGKCGSSKASRTAVSP